MIAVLSGATGLVGGRLVPALHGAGYRVRALTRRPEAMAAGPGVETLAWDARRLDPAALAGAECVIHLAGEPLFGRLPSAGHRRRVRESRLASTGAIVDAVASLPADERPRALVCASATGYYGARGEEALDEDAPPGEGFLAQLCRDWEAEAGRAEAHGVRRISLRVGVVLAREGGALALMSRIFRLGLGGRLGDGQQWFSWIHADDLVALVLRLAAEETARGPFNAVAPHPVRNSELTAALGRALSRPTLFRVPGFAVRTALGAFADELLGSRRVVPKRALELGFPFTHPKLTGALAAELGDVPLVV